MRWVTQVNVGIVIAEGRFVKLKTKELDIKTGSDNMPTEFIWRD